MSESKDVQLAQLVDTRDWLLLGLSPRQRDGDDCSTGRGHGEHWNERHGRDRRLRVLRVPGAAEDRACAEVGSNTGLGREVVLAPQPNLC